MDEIGKAVAEDRIRLGEATDMLVSAYVRMFGAPGPSQPREQVMARLMREHVDKFGVPRGLGEVDALETKIIKEALAVEVADISEQFYNLECRIQDRLLAAVDRADAAMERAERGWVSRAVTFVRERVGTGISSEKGIER